MPRDGGLERHAASEERAFALVEDFLKDVLVRKREASFGLARCECLHVPGDAAGTDGGETEDEAPPAASGNAPGCESCAIKRPTRAAGWLAQDNSGRALVKAVTHASSLLRLEHDAWKPRYCVFALEDKVLEVYRSESRALRGPSKAEVCIPAARIRSIELCGAKNTAKDTFKVHYSLSIGFLEDRGKGKEERILVLRFKPLESGDMELAARWAALLFYHTNRYDRALDALAARTSDAITRFQHVVRAQLRASPSDRSAGSAAADPDERSMLSYVSTFFRELQESDEEGDDESLRRGLRRPRSFSAGVTPHIQPLSEEARWVRSLREGEEEDEVWENERWSLLSIKDKNVVRGWTHGALFPQERRAVSDRVGNFVANSIEDIHNLPLPAGWTLTMPFIVDTSGLAHARCDGEGWRYESQFNALDSKQASGRQRGRASAPWVVRHRRWIRRRAPCPEALEEGSHVARDPSWLSRRGWLGLRGHTTGGLWRSRYCAVIMPMGPPPADEEVRAAWKAERRTRPAGLSVAMLVCLADKSSPRAGGPLIDWAALPKGSASIKPLDQDCSVREKEACPDFPGYFSLWLSGEKRPRLLNAESKECRAQWVNALRAAVAASLPREQTQVIVAEQTAGTAWERLARGRWRGGLPDEVDEGEGGEPGNGTNPKSRGYSKKGLSSVKSFVGKFGKASRSSTAREAAREAGQAEVAASGESGSKGPGPEEAADEQLEPAEVSLEDIDAAPVFEMPAPRENVVIDTDLAGVDLDGLADILFVDPSFDEIMDRKDGFTEVQRGPWDKGFAPGSKKTAQYTMPRNGPVPKNRASLAFVIEQAVPGAGYQIDQRVSNPEVPYGSCFNILLRFVITPGAETSATAPVAHVQVSHEVDFLQSTMMKGFIRSGSARELRSAFEKSWLPRLKECIAGRAAGQAAPGTTSSDGGDAKAGEAEASKAESSPQFKAPPPWDNLILQEDISMSVDELDAIIFQNEEFFQAQLKLDNVTFLDRKPWTDGHAVGSLREYDYIMPRMGMLPANKMQVTQVYRQAVPGQGYYVDQSVSNPDLPFGKTFFTMLHFVLEENEGKSQLRVYHSVKFVQSVNALMRGIIKATNKSEAYSAYRKKWLPLLQGYVASRQNQAAEGGHAGSSPEQDKVEPGAGLLDTNAVAAAVGPVGSALALRDWAVLALLGLNLYLVLQVRGLLAQQERMQAMLEAALHDQAASV